MNDKIQKILSKTTDNTSIFGTILRVERMNGEVLFDGATGNLKTTTQYFIASTTKLYTVAIIMKLRSEGRLSLDDKLDKFFDAEIIKGLNVFKGVDYSDNITIQQLLAHTSGIPDYFSGNNTAGVSLVEELSAGKDRSWSFEDSIKVAKAMKPTFRPGQKGKALYSDTNFQILGRIIELLRGDVIENIFQREIFDQLGLKDTYMFIDERDHRPADMYFNDKKLPIPQAMKSTKADGGIVSTSEDSMKFIRNFFAGFFFPKGYFKEMRVDYRGVMFPLQYGTGLMRFKLPRLFTMFQNILELIGHSGLSGAFEYYCPEKDIFLTGTVNQINKPSTSYRLLSMVLMQIK